MSYSILVESLRHLDRETTGFRKELAGVTLYSKAADEIERLTAENEALKAAADRYRFIEKVGMPDMAEFWPAINLDTMRYECDRAWSDISDKGLGLSAAIDAMILQFGPDVAKEQS
jgi:hypothetical protein